MAEAWSCRTVPLPVVIFLVALCGLFGAALWLRARTASQIGAAYLLAAAVSNLVYAGSFRGVVVGIALVDLLLLLWLGRIALFGEAWWPTMSASLQVVTILGHLARMARHATPMAYAIMAQWTAWPSLLILAVGIALDLRAGRTFSPLRRQAGPQTQ